MEGNRLKDYVSGVELVKRGQYAEAVDHLTKYVKSGHPDVGRADHARMLCGFAHAQMDEWDAAAEQFRVAMTNDIECVPAYTALGHSYLMAGRTDESIDIFKVAVQKDPKNAQAHHGLGWALLEKGDDLGEALYQTQEALRLSPQSAAIRDSVGWALYKSGALEAAAEQMDEAVKLDPDHPTILAHRREIREKLREKS